MSRMHGRDFMPKRRGLSYPELYTRYEFKRQGIVSSVFLETEGGDAITTVSPGLAKSCWMYRYEEDTTCIVSDPTTARKSWNR